jgi:hypothetical protein
MPIGCRDERLSRAESVGQRARSDLRLIQVGVM